MAVRSSNLWETDNQTPSFFLKIAQFLNLKKEIISLTGLNLSFSDLGYFNLEFDTLQSKIGCELSEFLKSWNMGLFWYIKVLIDVHIQGIDRLVLCGNKVLQQLTQATSFLCSRKDTSREESSVKDIHWFQRSPYRTSGPNHAGFFPFGYLDDKVWNMSCNPNAVN